MTKALSQLIYSPFQSGSGGRSVVTMHRHNDFTDSTREIGLAVSSTGRVVGLQSSKGVYVGRDVVGYTWFIGPLHQPSPIFFGDALSDIERFLWDEIDQGAAATNGLPFLIGIEQGATMALATAAAVPELLSGVIAIEPIFPTVSGWTPPLAPLADLPILLVNQLPDDRFGPDVLTGVALTRQLTEWGGVVTEIDEPAEPATTIASWLANQPVRWHRA